MDECQSSPCQNGGLCAESDDAGYTCSCPNGISGATCSDVRTADFNGSHVLRLPPLSQLARAGEGGQGGQGEQEDQEDQEQEDQEQEGRRRRKREAASTVQMRFTFTTTVPEGLLLFASGVRPVFYFLEGGGARGGWGGG